MIYTCTLNPSLDYYMEFDKVELGKKMCIRDRLHTISEENHLPRHL